MSSLLIDYVQPLTTWLQQHPHWTLLITFIISMTESLAIIGSIIPGSVTMTAIGILAGSGIVRIDLTLLAATLGAIAGDSLSYAIGYFYSDRLVEMWPFKKYPTWLQYGKEFFARHGGKSVLIGRFVGPLRSIIPIIAGIMHMKHWQFFIANTISAIGWSILYVMPGVLIGAASHELSAESATRLFILILIILAGIWAFSLIIQWTLNKLTRFLNKNLHALWLKLRKTAISARIYKWLTPKGESNHYSTALLGILALINLAFFITLAILTVQNQWISSINLPIHLFIQSFHSLTLEAFFIFCAELTSTITLTCLFIICCGWFIYHKKGRLIFYLCSLLLLTTGIAFLFNHYITSPRPPGLLVMMSGSSFPAINLMIASAFYGFILFYLNSIYRPLTHALQTVMFTILGLSGIAALYLGDYWLTDILASYTGGATIALIYCLLYRKVSFKPLSPKHAALMIFSLLFVIILASAASTYINFRTLSYNHTPYRKEFILQESSWWNQQKPLLPIYRLNRIGKRISLLNIEYSGELEKLEKHLSLNGWVTHTESFFSNLLVRINNRPNDIKPPLLTQLYENRAPSLIMLYKDKENQLNLELRIWESNYNLSHSNKFVWIGSIHATTPAHRKSRNIKIDPTKAIDILSYLDFSKSSLLIKKITLPDSMVKTTIYPTQPYILLIKENPEFH